MATKCFILSVAVYLTGVAAKCEHKLGLDPHNDCEGKNYWNCMKEFDTVCTWDGPKGYDGVHALQSVNADAWKKEWVRGSAWVIEQNGPVKPSKALKKTKDVLQKELLDADDMLLLFKFEYYGSKKKHDTNKLPMCFYEKIFNELYVVANKKGYINDLQRGLYNKPTQTGQGDLADCDYLDGMVYKDISATNRLYDIAGPPTANTDSDIIRTLLKDVDTVLTEIDKQAKLANDQTQRTSLAKYQKIYQKRLDSLVKAANDKNKLKTTKTKDKVSWSKIIKHQTTEQLKLKEMTVELYASDLTKFTKELKDAQKTLENMKEEYSGVRTKEQELAIAMQEQKIANMKKDFKEWQKGKMKSKASKRFGTVNIPNIMAHQQYYDTYNEHVYEYGYVDDEGNEMMMSQSAYTPSIPDTYPYVAALNLTNDASMTLVLVLIAMMMMMFMCVCCGCTGFFVGIGCYVFGCRYYATKTSQNEDKIDHLNNV